MEQVETWRPIKGWEALEGFVEVSDQGRLRYVDKTPIATSFRRDGHEVASVRVACRESKGRRVAQLQVSRAVLATFAPGEFDVPQCNGLNADSRQAHHLNKDPRDNRLVNLRWVTCSEHRKLHPRGPQEAPTRAQRAAAKRALREANRVPIGATT